MKAMTKCCLEDMDCKSLLTASFMTVLLKRLDEPIQAAQVKESFFVEGGSVIIGQPLPLSRQVCLNSSQLRCVSLSLHFVPKSNVVLRVCEVTSLAVNRMDVRADSYPQMVWAPAELSSRKSGTERGVGDMDTQVVTERKRKNEEEVLKVVRRLQHQEVVGSLR